MRTTTSTLWAALVLGLSACDGDATGTAGGAQLQVAARGDDAPAAQSVAPAEGGSYTHTGAQGTIDFRARVYVQSSTSGWVELTNAAASSARVAASGHGEAVAFASGRVSAGSYNRVRVVFEDVDANLSSGIQLSTGLLTGTVSVNLESDGQVVVEREVNLSANSGAASRIVINLNADAWLNSANAHRRRDGVPQRRADHRAVSRRRGWMTGRERGGSLPVVSHRIDPREQYAYASWHQSHVTHRREQEPCRSQ